MSLTRRSLLKTIACSVCLPSLDIIIPNDKPEIVKGYNELDFDQIEPHSKNPKNYYRSSKELLNHIRQHGVLNPLEATWDGQSDYVVLIHGFGRFHALMELQRFRRIPTMVHVRTRLFNCFTV